MDQPALGEVGRPAARPEGVLDDLDVEVGGVRLDDVAVGRGDRDHALPALPLEQAVGEGAQVVHALRVHARGGQRHPGAPAPRLQAAPLQLGVAELLLQLVDPLLRLAQAPLQVGPGRLRRRLPPLQLVLRRLARHQVDPAQPGADAPLGTDQHHPHLGRALEVGAAAQLAGQSPKQTTRTTSPYFSPKSAIAPEARASAIGRWLTWRGSAARTCWFTNRPTRFSSTGARARLKEKSKVVWSGPT